MVPGHLSENGGDGDDEREEGDEEEEVEVEEEEDDGEEEPRLKYQRMGGNVPSLLSNDAAASIAIAERMIALGTHNGTVHILDFQGNQVKEFHDQGKETMEGRGEQTRVSSLKIVSYNVNGLRSRVSQHGSLLKLLNSLDADIICFQETKMSRQDLSTDLTRAEGYESFFSCTRTSTKGRTGYSGVATFCRVHLPFSSKEVALPLAAEEGITGLLGYSGKKESMERSIFLRGLEDVSTDDLVKIDGEGRCLITDHGHFVLFNIYGPRAEHDDDERLQFKFLFFLVLEKRWKYLHSQGKRVIVVGDFNIAPAAVDCCDAAPDFEDNRFRKWLRDLLVERGGSFVDCFRAMHPNRKEAYTCWPQSVGGEEFNFGSRIDHIIISGSCFHKHIPTGGHTILECNVDECDIMIQYRRGKVDNIPKWKGGRSVKLEGSDHVPVFIILKDIPDLSEHSTPPLSVRYIPEVRGRQLTMAAILTKRKTANSTECCEESCLLTTEDLLDTNSGQLLESSQEMGFPKYVGSQKVHDSFCRNITSIRADTRSNNHIVNEDLRSSSEFSDKKDNLSLRCSGRISKKVRQGGLSQLSIRSFLQQPETCSHTETKFNGQSHTLSSCSNTGQTSGCTSISDATSTRIANKITFERENLSVHHVTSMGQASQGEVSALNPKEYDELDIGISSSEKEKSNVALLKWQNIQDKMQNSLPVCKGHGEPCVARSVKKSGPNVGRGFYVCARAKGPASNSEANCGHFEWASSRTKKKR